MDSSDWFDSWFTLFMSARKGKGGANWNRNIRRNMIGILEGWLHAEELVMTIWLYYYRRSMKSAMPKKDIMKRGTKILSVDINLPFCGGLILCIFDEWVSVLADLFGMQTYFPLFDIFVTLTCFWAFISPGHQLSTTSILSVSFAFMQPWPLRRWFFVIAFFLENFHRQMCS